jgi:hypothetical protein
MDQERSRIWRNSGSATISWAFNAAPDYQFWFGEVDSATHVSKRQ